jgi:glycosyltransferase involved in cell wall biosynthesis
VRQGQIAKGSEQMCRKPIKVLQVVRGVPGGGVEIRLLQLMRQIDREHIKFDFCALWPPSANSASFHDEVEALGGRVFPCRFLPNLPTFPLRFRRILRAGRYDVVHSHVGWPSGVVLCQASLEGVPARIAHSHNSDDLNPHSLLRNAWRAAMKACIQKYMTVGLAVSAEAAEFLFGPQWRSDPRFRLFRPAIDLEPFRAAPSREEARRELGIPVNAPVVGHVGQFVARKNHAFLLKVAVEVLKLRPEVRFLMVGDGPMRSQIEAMAGELGIEKSVILTGPRPDTDIPRLMPSAMDVFAFPSIEEGLPAVLVEAQAAGLRALASDAVPSEVGVVPGAVEFLSLSCGAKRWAGRLLRMLDSGRVDREIALRTLEQSDFNVRQSCRELTRMYEMCLARGRP